MDVITRDLDLEIKKFKLKGQTTNVACLNKIKIDYFLMLTIATAWDLKKNSMSFDNRQEFFRCLQRPETGKLIRLIESVVSLDKRIVDIWDEYKNGRNNIFGHNTFDRFQANILDKTCESCCTKLTELPEMDSDNNIIRKLYNVSHFNDFYYIEDIDSNGSMIVKKFGEKNDCLSFSKNQMAGALENQENKICKNDLFIFVSGKYIKISPFIQYGRSGEPFFMLLDILSSPPTLKMAYICRTETANDSEKYIDKFPDEFKPYFSYDIDKLGKNGIAMNKFSQIELFKDEYYKEINSNVQAQLDKFISGNMSYGAVRGIAGVGKTSTVFMWINRILNNENGILDEIRKKFQLKRIIFLSAKRKIYSREIDAEKLSNFYDIDSDVGNYDDIITKVYAELHTQEKDGTSFEEKIDYLKKYSKKSYGILIIIDDYESLPDDSRYKIQELKDFFDPNAVKMLITTRFSSKEAKDIIVVGLNKGDCAKMTDYIFKDTKWRSELTELNMHKLTGGLPLLIWYAKAYFKMGQLSAFKNLSNESENALSSYLYDNFVQCFQDIFTKNLLMILKKYYDLYNVTQISKNIALFLCLKNPKSYNSEDEDFYFQELADLKLISFHRSARSINFSPLTNYMTKTSKIQEPTEIYQKDSLKILDHLEEELYEDIYAVIESNKYAEKDVQSRILQRVIDFAQNDNKLKSAAIEKIFTLTDNKLKLYKENKHLFQNESNLINIIIDYFLKDNNIINQNTDLIREFVCALPVSLKNINSMCTTSCNIIHIIITLLSQLLEQRYDETITNHELRIQAQMLRESSLYFLSQITDDSEIENLKKQINTPLCDISAFCSNNLKI